MPDDVSAVLEALSAGNDNELIGLRESLWFDAKSAPYRLDDAKSVWELAKDVSAMANARGGIVVIAATTERRQDSLEEYVTGVSGFPMAMFDEERARNLLKDRIFPPLGSRITIHRFARPRNQSVVAIEVAPAPDDDRPVLVRTKATVEVDQSSHELELWAIAVRVGAGTEWEPAPKVWADIRDGRLARRHLTLPAVGTHASPGTRRESAIDRVVAAVGLEDLAYWSLAAYPSRPVRLEAFYTDDGIRGALERLPYEGLRPSGFGLGYGLELTSLEAGLALIEPARRGLLVDPDGLVIAVAAGTPEMLGWADRRPVDHSHTPLRVNPYVVVEWPAEFTRFTHQHVTVGLEGVEWRYWTRAERLRTGTRPLEIGPDPFHGQPAIVDRGEAEFDASESWESDAYGLLDSFMQWFGQRARELPFVGEGTITAEDVRSMS